MHAIEQLGHQRQARPLAFQMMTQNIFRHAAVIVSQPDLCGKRLTEKSAAQSAAKKKQSISSTSRISVIGS